MKIHENWCLESEDGFHCYHAIMPNDDKDPTHEICCWCGRVKLITFYSTSAFKKHGNYTKSISGPIEIDPDYVWMMVQGGGYSPKVRAKVAKIQNRKPNIYTCIKCGKKGTYDESFHFCSGYCDGCYCQ